GVGPPPVRPDVDEGVAVTELLDCRREVLGDRLGEQGDSGLPARMGPGGVEGRGIEIGGGHLGTPWGWGRTARDRGIAVSGGGGRGATQRRLGLAEDGAVDHAAVQLEDALVVL